MIEYLSISNSFFGEQGITATSANHLANLAKQKYETLEASLANIRFVTEKFGLISQPEENYANSSMVNTNCEVQEYIAILNRISAYKGFIAFLREAIKHKRELENDALSARDPEIKEIKHPDFPVRDTIEVYISKLPIKEREHYLSLEAKCATYGKFIHPGGSYDSARKQLLNAINEPRRVSYQGADTIIRVVKPAFSPEQVDAVLDELQSIHRASEAELNGIKTIIEQNILKKFNADLDEYRKATAECEARTTELLTREEESRKERMELIRNLKIQIPNKYKEIYEELTRKNK